MVILSLGDGWYNLENSKEGSFFWSSDQFSIYIESSLLELELYLNCNKTKSPYKLFYSLNGWETQESVDLDSGLNVVNVILNGSKRVDFKCDYFIPSQTTSSNDNRKLGVQLVKLLYKTIDDKCFESDINNIKTKFEIESLNNLNDIDDDCFKITLDCGWNDLEEGSFRWSTGCGGLYIKDRMIKDLKISISSPINQKILVKYNVNNEFELNVSPGINNLYLNNLLDVKLVQIISEQHKSAIEDDNRKLGIQLYSVDASYKDGNVIKYFVKNLFFEKDFNKLINFIDHYKYENKLFNFNSDGHVCIKNFENVESGKFNLNNQTVFYTHRSGWAYAINCIKNLHSSDGIRFEGFLEKTFSWEKYNNIKKNVIPFKEHWVGVIHNPMMSENNLNLFSTKKLFNSIVFLKSLETCKGLYVLSNDLKEKIKDKVGNVPIEFLYHPTETPKSVFTMERFKNNVDKKIVSVGSWARRFLTIYLLKTPDYMKKRIIEPASLTPEKFQYMLELEKTEMNFTGELDDTVEFIDYQDSECYDRMLSNNIMFMDFYDISASNLIIECIVRNTPILVKKHNAVIDYLGIDYPFYFNTVEEASDKINNETLIEETYTYLLNLKTKEFLTQDYFINSITNGKIYNCL